MLTIYNDYDMTGFWSDDDYSLEEYVEKNPSTKAIASVEKKLGYKLPASYIELMRVQNGGLVNKTCFPTAEPTSWAEDHITISGISGIGSTKAYSLCGSLGSKFMIEEWGYPDIGVCICDTPSAGHDLVMLDYSACGPEGEPRVVHVDQEMDYEITFLAPSFEAFVRGLVSEDVYDTSAADLEDALKRIESGSFSTVLTQFFGGKAGQGLEKHVRCLLLKLTRAKGYFALHSDPESQLIYDLQFYAHHKNKGATTQKEYLEDYPSSIAFSDGAISTKGYAPAFVEDWLNQRLSEGHITKNASGKLQCTSSFEKALLVALRSHN